MRLRRTLDEVGLDEAADVDAVELEVAEPPAALVTRESRPARAIALQGGSTPKQKESPRLPTSGQLPRGLSRGCHFEGGLAATNEAGGGRARIRHDLFDPPGHPAREHHERCARMPRESRPAAARSHLYSSINRMQRLTDDLWHQDSAWECVFSSIRCGDQGNMGGLAGGAEFETHGPAPARHAQTSIKLHQ